MSFKVFPAELCDANNFVREWHRHHKPCRGHRWSIGARDDKKTIRGYAIVGRPVARKTCQRTIVEVLRLVTDGTPNACSFLYGATARIARELGFQKIQTFTLASEHGSSLRAAGWTCVGKSNGKAGWHTREGRRYDQPEEEKLKWEKIL